MRTRPLKIEVIILSFCFGTGFSFGQYFVNPGASSLTSQPYLYNYKPESLFEQYANNINKPIVHSELGLTPQYRNLVYNYVKDFAGTEAPQLVSASQPFSFSSLNNENQFFPQQTNINFPSDVTTTLNDQASFNIQATQSSTSGINENKPELNDYFLPSDSLSLANQPEVGGNVLRRNFEIFKIQKLKPTSLPPIGGVISDYVLLRSHQNFPDFQPKVSDLQITSDEYQQIKRELPDDSDSVVVEAEPFQNTKNQEEPAEHKEDDAQEDDENSEEEDTHPGIAQSKPAAIALAGPGGVAQASPVATALVGPGGLAVSAPSGTAVAGTNTQGAGGIQIGGEKQKNEKTEDHDSD